MSNKRIKELRNLTKEELTAKARELEKSLFDLRLKKATGQLEKSAELWKSRKDVARIRMLLGARPAGNK